MDSGKNIDCGQQMTIAADIYVCEQNAAKERQYMFQQYPQIIGLSADLPAPNTFIALDDFGIPLLATRDGDDKFHVFVNACSHRGARVTNEERGSARGFSCVFHGWAYGTKGDLKGVRREGEYGPIDKACSGLTELPSAEYGGLLIVHPQVGGEIDVEALLGDVRDEFLGLDIEKMVFQNSSTLEMALNWKLANDTFGETYHFDILHKNTLANIVHGDVTDCESMGKHHRISLARRDIAQLRELPEADWQLLNYSTTIFYVFPNVQLVFNAAGITMVRIYPCPDNPGRSITCLSHYLHEETITRLESELDAPRLTADQAYDCEARSNNAIITPAVANEIFSSTIEKEDYAMGEQAQIAIQSGYVKTMNFGHNEPGLQHFHSVFAEFLAAKEQG